jgi:hypothetical protein
LFLQKGDQKPNKDFKKTKTADDVAEVFTEYIENDAQIRVSTNKNSHYPLFRLLVDYQCTPNGLVLSHTSKLGSPK